MLKCKKQIRGNICRISFDLLGNSLCNVKLLCYSKNCSRALPNAIGNQIGSRSWPRLTATSTH